MNSHFKRFAVGAILLALPAVASASSSRVEGMAIPGDYIRDYTGIYTYISGITGVGNLVYGELGDTRTPVPVTSDRQVGAVLGTLFDGRFGTWGIHLREQTPNLGQADAFSNPNVGTFGVDPNTHTNQSFDIMWVQRFGTTRFGLRLERSYFAFETTVPGVTTTLKYDVPVGGLGGAGNLARNIFGVQGGVGFELNPSSTLEAAILWQTRDFEGATTGGTRQEDDGTTTWQVAGRLFWEWQPNVLVVPVIKFHSFDLGSVVTPPAGPGVASDNSLTGWQAGVAGNWTIGTNDLFVLGTTFAQNRFETQEDLFGLSTAIPGVVFAAEHEVTESITPQVFAALETHLSSWLTARFGATKGWFTNIKIEDATQEGKISSSPFTMELGLGIKLGSLQFDGVLNPSFPQTLGGFMSQTPGYVTFPKVTATYAF
jgi:hypothetical protein